MYRIKTRLSITYVDGATQVITAPTKYRGYALKKDYEAMPQVEKVEMEVLERTIYKRDGL